MKNTEKRSGVVAWSVVALFSLVVFLFSARQCSAANREGWLVVITAEKGKTTVKRLTSEDAVYRVVSLYFPALEDEKAIVRNKFFEVRTETVSVYVERRRVVETKSGKLKFRKIKR